MKPWLHWISEHSGVPTLVVVAVIVVVSWRILKFTWKLLIEVAIVAALLVVATKLGWIAF